MATSPGQSGIKVLLVGSGAREHAIASKLKSSHLLGHLYVWPGNPCINRVGEPIDLPANSSFEKLIAAAKDIGIDFVFCGPEKPLSDGLADAFNSAGIPVFGPNKAAAMLESSKAFAKEIMQEAGIPTADFSIVNNKADCRAQALKMLSEEGGVVLKASGLAAGKGVFVCRSVSQVHDGLDRLYSEAMKAASEIVVIEKMLLGRECSYFVFLGKGAPVSVGFAVDFKRLLNNDEGPNTGGMGCYAPVPWLPENAALQVDAAVVQPLLRTLKTRGLNYTGCLYVGIMWGNKGPQVVEFNVRLGDPEAQVLTAYDSRDWLHLAAAKVGVMPDPTVGSSGNKSRRAVAVVLAGAGYPFGEKPDFAAAIPWSLIDPPRTASLGNVQVFGASLMPAKSGNTADGVETGSGRVLTVVAVNDSFKHSRSMAYSRVDAIRAIWKDCQFRTDIAADVEGS